MGLPMHVIRPLRRIAALGCTSAAILLATTGCDSSGTPATTPNTDGAAASTTPQQPEGAGGGKGKGLPGRGGVPTTKKEVQAGGSNIPDNKPRPD